MSRSFIMPTPQLIRRGVSLNRNLAHRTSLIVLLTALATLPFWLGLEWVHSAPAESAGPPLAMPGPPAGPTPSVTLDVPDEVLIGDTFKFTMTFTPGNVVGFGPFVDLVIPSGGTNYTAATGPCDGITFISAEMIGVNGGPVPLTTFPAAAPPCTTNPTPPVCETLPHPFAASGISTILVPPGSQLFTIKLPFGSFQVNQPPITIQVTASVSSFANDHVPLNIYARAGYQFGSIDALNNPIPDPPVLSPGGVSDCVTWDAFAPVTPVLFTFKVEDPLTNSGPCYDGIDNGSDNLIDSKDPDCKHAKTYIGPEDETATGPNYPRQYKITLDIAAGQTVNNLTVQDCLPNNVVFTGVGSSTAPTPLSPPLAQTGPLNNNCLSFNYPSIVGTSSTNDIVIFVQFYVPQNDANGIAVLDPATCSNATSPNDVKASGNWTPTDPRDPATPVTNDAATVDHLLTDKRIAIQKSVETYPVPNAPLIPGGVLKYTLNFQVSDFFTVGHIVVTDVLSDGQDLITAPAGPKLIVSDRRGPNPTVVPFSSGSNFLDAPNPFVDCGGVRGGRSLVFQVSAAMQNNAGLFSDPLLQQGILTGGWAFTPTSSTPATGQIEFYVVVRDKFIHSQPTGDQFVDKDDPINNCVTVSADIYTNHATLPVPKSPQLRCSDDSATALSIVTDTLKKSVYAIKRGGSFVCGPSSINGACPLPPAAPEVRPGDQVTFRIEKTIPSGDAEDVIVEDWLPQPIFNVGNTAFQNIPCVGVPLAGNACLGPNDQLHLPPILAAPTFNAITATNSLSFTYADFSYTANLPRKIDLLFTHTVTNLPFADGLHLTNEVQECENNTFAKRFCQAAIAQVTLREPNLRIRKGVIATNNPNGLFSQPGPPPTANLATAQAPPNAALTLAGISQILSPSAMVNSNDLATGILNSNLLGGVDANDIVTFAITIENQGGHPAYNAKLEERLPDCLTNLSNIVVKRGTGAVVNPLLYTVAPATTGPGFTITSIPGAPINAYHPTNGANIVVITFQARLKADVTPGCCNNVAELKHYASQNGGPNFVSAGFTPPFEDPAEVCVKPVLTKSLVTTSEAHTAGSNVAVGEIARYRLLVQLPEGGLLPNFQVTDALPAGMKFLNDGTARLGFIANSTSFMTHPFGITYNFVGNQTTLPFLGFNPGQAVSGIGGATCGAPVTFNLGNIKNNDNDNDLEYIVIEFNALFCNEAGNQSGTPLSNTFSVSVGGTQIATSNPINVTIVEPNFTMTKTVAPNPAVKGQTLTYTVQYTNNGSADAFNVELKDTLPAGLTFGTITAGCAFTNVPANTLTVTCAQIPKAPNPGSTVIVTYQALANPATCPVTLENRANLTWTSLPGLKGTLVNPTGSSTPGNSGADDGERDGVTPLLTLNDYRLAAAAAVKIDCPCEAMITGLKFHDLNGNGVRDTGEPGLANWTIQVTDSNGITHTTTTDSQGNYSFTVPAPETYTVAEVLQSGWTQTAPTTGTHTVTVSPGQVVTNLSFGNWKKQKGCDLEIKKEVKPNPLVSGQQATATITVKNVGTSPCHGPTQVAESMPAGLTLVSASVPGGNCVVATGICTYPPAILPGASIVFTYVFNVTAKPGTKFENCAKLKNSEDKNPANNSTCIPLTVSDVKLPDLTIQKKVQCDGPAIPQGTCNVTFTITNNGPGAFNGILVIKDLVTPTPSPGLGWAGSSTPPGWSCSIGGSDSVSCATTSSVSMVPGQSTSFSILLKVPDGQFQNCASVKGYTQFPYSASTLIQEGDFNNNESCVSMGGSSSGDCATPPPGMVAWWPLDETAGATTVTDIIGVNNGTPQPGPIGPSNSGPLPGISSGVTPPAMVGGSLYFYSQANRFVRVPNTSAPSLNFGAGDFTVDAWVYPVQVGQTVVQPIVDKLQLVSSPAAGIGYRLFILNGKLQFVLLDGLTAVNTQAPITAGQWQHVAVVRSGGTPNTVKVYIGGQLISTSTPVVGNISNNADLLIGGIANSPGTGGLPSGFGYGEIAIDEVEIFKTALAQSDIVRIYRAGSAGKCKSLATIKGKKFNDLNKSKELDPGEPGLSGWTIQVQDRGGNTKSTTTDAQGNYSFTVPAPGTYTLSEVNQEGWSPTTRDRTVTLASNQSAEVDFGNISVRRRDPFTLERGMNEFCFWGSGGPYNSPRPIDNPNLGFTNNLNPTLVGNTGGSRFGAIGLCYGRIFYANDTIAFKYTFNATPVGVLSYPDVNPVFVDRGFPIPVSHTRRNVFGSGLSPIGLQLYFRPQSRIKPFVNTSAGFLFFKHPIPRLNGTRLNFTYDFGGGIQIFRDAKRAFTFGYKHQRLFNGGGALNNPGLNGNVFSFGYSIFK